MMFKIQFVRLFIIGFRDREKKKNDSPKKKIRYWPKKFLLICYWE